MDSLDKKSRTFFQQCKRGELQNEGVEEEFQNLRKDYYKVLEDADEKVTIATQIHELVERYLRRLDSELFKFKCELEADNNGITEILEKRSLEMDGGSSAATALMNAIGMNQKENRYYGSLPAATATLPVATNSSHNLLGISSSGGAAVAAGLADVSSGGSRVSIPTAAAVLPNAATPKDNRYRTPKPEKRRDSNSSLLSSVLPEKRPNLGNSLGSATTAVPTANATIATPSVGVVRPITPGIGIRHEHIHGNATAVNSTAGSSTVAYNLQQLSAGGAATNAIAAAASQAIMATQQMQQGRRTASLKASYEAIHGSGPTEFWIPRDIAAAGTPNTFGADKNKKK